MTSTTIGNATLYLGTCEEVLPTLSGIHACVTDPPYGLKFMGKAWDYDVPRVDSWSLVLAAMLPGAHLLSFAGTRTQHRMAVNIEDAGFEIRDLVMWHYGNGFPKSLDVSKAIDKHGGAQVAWFGTWFRKWREANGVTQRQVAALFPSKTGGLTGCVANWELGFNMPTPDQFNMIRDTFNLPFESIEEAEREVVGQKDGNLLAVSPGQDNDRSATTMDITSPATPEAREWEGWGTALKPATEIVTMARKPLAGTVAQNVLEHGCGGINVGACRVHSEDVASERTRHVGGIEGNGSSYEMPDSRNTQPPFRWPANLIHDGSPEVTRLFPVTTSNSTGKGAVRGIGFGGGGQGVFLDHRNADTGSAARFFYSPKASKEDRDEGCQGLAQRTAGECTDRNDGTDGLNSPRAGAGRTSGSRNHHPTVKPVDLMRWLCRLVTPPRGIVLDPYMGSGSTGKAAVLEGFRFIGIERDPAYFEIACARLRIAVEWAKQPVQQDLIP